MGSLCVCCRKRQVSEVFAEIPAISSRDVSVEEDVLFVCACLKACPCICVQFAIKD